MTTKSGDPNGERKHPRSSSCVSDFRHSTVISYSSSLLRVSRRIILEFCWRSAIVLRITTTLLGKESRCVLSYLNHTLRYERAPWLQDYRETYFLSWVSFVELILLRLLGLWTHLVRTQTYGCKKSSRYHFSWSSIREFRQRPSKWTPIMKAEINGSREVRRPDASDATDNPMRRAVDESDWPTKGMIPWRYPTLS